MINQVKRTICSIDIFRYICAIMVVSIHATPFLDINERLSYIFTNIIPRIAVPFFYAVAGYFFIQKLEKNQNVFFKYIKRLLITYFIWTVFYFVITLISNDVSFIDLFKTYFKSFFIEGSYYHFWFFPALIFSVCLTTLLFKIKCSKLIVPLSFILYCIGCLGCSYYFITINIPILGDLYRLESFNIIRRIFLMAFPFFISGYIVYKIKDRVFNYLSTKQIIVLEVLSIFIWLLEIYVVIKFKFQTNIIITFGLFLLVITTMLVLLRCPLYNYSSLSSKCLVLANFTYYSHPFFMTCISFMELSIFHVDIKETLTFLITILLTYLVGTIIYKLNNKYLNILIH